MLEEDQLGQLGVLEHQTDSATEFGLRAKRRLESMKAFVRQDCSARLARARVRQSGPKKRGVQSRRSHHVPESRRTEMAWTRAHYWFCSQSTVV